MWGGLDFSKVTQLGSQLNDALQRAKTEFDKLDGPFAYESDSRHTGISDPGLGGEFSVGAGLLSGTGVLEKQEASPREAFAAEGHSRPAAPAGNATATASSSNGTPGSLQLPEGTHDDAHMLSTSTAETENGTLGQPSPAGKLVKKKVIKKIVRKVPPGSQSATADAGTAEAEPAKNDGRLAEKQRIVELLSAAAGLDADPAATHSTHLASKTQWAEQATVSNPNEAAASETDSPVAGELPASHAAATSAGATLEITTAAAPRPTSGKKERVKKGLGAVKIQQQTSLEMPEQQPRQQQQAHEHQPGQALSVETDSTGVSLHELAAAEQPHRPQQQHQQGMPEASSARPETEVAEQQAHDVSQVEQPQWQWQEQLQPLSATMHEQQQQNAADQLNGQLQQQHVLSDILAKQPHLHPGVLQNIEQPVCEPAAQQQHQQGAEVPQLELDNQQLSLSVQHDVVEQLVEELLEACIQHAAAEAEPAAGQQRQQRTDIQQLQQQQQQQQGGSTHHHAETAAAIAAAHSSDAAHQHAAEKGASASSLVMRADCAAAAATIEVARAVACAAVSNDFSAALETSQHQQQAEDEGWEQVSTQHHPQQQQHHHHHRHQHSLEQEGNQRNLQQQHGQGQQQHRHEDPCEQQEQQQQQQQGGELLSSLKQQCHGLQQQLILREQQIGRQAEQLSMLQAEHSALQSSKQELEGVIVQLTAQNEKLVMRASKVNEEELQEIQREASERLAAAERKVFALMKERDALKRSAASAAAAATETADTRRLEAELKKKEELVVQLMEEGEKLSRRQLDLEGTVKRLRAAAKAAESDKEKLSALLAAERAEAENLRKAKTKAERDLVAALEAGRQEVEAVRQAGKAELLEARAELAAAEATAAEAATEGLASSLAASEARCAALADSVTELQEALERQRAAADLREEMLRQDLADLERRAQAAELRHQELSSKLPEATAPLLRQISALQDASTAHAQAWAAAERSLTARVRDAEAAAAVAAEAQRDAEERLTALHARLAAAEQATTNAKAAAAEASARANRAEERLAHTESQLEDAQAAAREAQSVSFRLREDLQQLEQSLKRKLGNETAARKAAEEELTHVRQELSQLQGMLGPGVSRVGLGEFMGSGGFAGLGQAASMPVNGTWRNTATAGPPALAGPGFKWVLVREGEDPAAAPASSRGQPQQPQQDDSDELGSLPGTPHSVRSGTAISSARQLQLPTAGSTASSVAGFDTEELLRHHSQAGPLSDAASTGGPASPSVGGSSTKQQQQALLRQAQQRLDVGTVGEAELHRLRLVLRQKKGECAALQGRLKELEETRDQLASELVKATHAAEKAADAVAEVPKLQAAYQELQDRYAAAVELVGERDEQLEELQNDLEDMKLLYRQQIEALLEQPQQQ